MGKIQEIEKQLELAKKEEALQYKVKELEEIKSQYEGKCFGSHTFDRSNAAACMGAVYYEKFYLKEGEIYVLEHTISLSHMDGFHKKSMKQISYNRNIYERKLTGNNYNASYNLYSGYSHFRKEITQQKFKELWEIAEEANLVIKNAFRGKMPELKTEWITQGDFGYEEKISQCLNDMGIEMIDFKDFPLVHNCIEYRTLPMFDKRRWLPKLYAKPILQWQIEQLEEDCKSSFCTGRRYDSLQREIKILQDFISTL